MRNVSISLLLMALTVSPAFADAFDRIGEAEEVFTEIMSVREKGIPSELLEKAHCLVIIPSAKKAGFIFGGQYGRGVALCRQPGNAGWTGPSSVKMEGGSFGLQIGAGETDIVMMVMNRKGADKLMQSKFTLGGEGSVMAGPIGRSATAETDAYLRAEILSYSRSRGLFAGVALKGSTLRADASDNKKIYGRSVTHEQILKGRVPVPAVAQPLIDTINRYSVAEKISGGKGPAIPSSGLRRDVRRDY